MMPSIDPLTRIYLPSGSLKSEMWVNLLFFREKDIYPLCLVFCVRLTKCWVVGVEEFGAVSNWKMCLLQQNYIYFQGVVDVKCYSLLPGGIQPLSIVCLNPEIRPSQTQISHWDRGMDSY